ncbi:MAG: hypothetical protein WC025_01600 [Candidatus Magasanikbacteria bacterium]
MRQEIDKIKIKEPPIEELSKQKSCIKSSCATSCGCFTILFIISILLLKFAFGPTTKELKDLPESFTSKIPIYDITNVEKITHTSGKEKSTKIERAAFLPKLVLSPFIIYFDRNFKYIPRTKPEGEEMTNIDKLVAFMQKPLSDERDVYKIEWIELDAKQDFLLEYYKTELKKKGFEIEQESNNKDVKEFTFFENSEDITGVVYTVDNQDTKYTDYMSVTINTPSE